MKILKSISYPVLVLFFLLSSVNAQEVKNNYQTRTSIELGFKPLNNLRLNLTPELFFDDNISLDKYLFEGEAVYKPVKVLALGATYRFVGNVQDNQDTEYLNRIAFSATVKNDFNRFEPLFRLRYSNYADDEITDKEFIRYKTSLKYDIANCKITPFVGIEAFQQLSDNELYKIRYALGFKYKMFKNNYIGCNYNLDYYLQELRNKHIFSLTYKIRL